ncbi:MAG TPA: hypothetical protein VHC22_30840 [Pirellulales bacterium]|nr:hypothetical protein [Pirellulales bacterium]
MTTDDSAKNMIHREPSAIRHISNDTSTATVRRNQCLGETAAHVATKPTKLATATKIATKAIKSKIFSAVITTPGGDPALVDQTARIAKAKVRPVDNLLRPALAGRP